MSDLTIEQYRNEEYLNFEDPTFAKAQQAAIRKFELSLINRILSTSMGIG